MLAPQDIVLCCHAGRAIIQVADTQVLAAERDHRRGTEAEALGAQDRRLDDVEARLQSAIGLQAHLVPQIIGPQHLLRLGQAELPRTARVLHGALRTRARAAVVAGDRDQVGIAP